MRRRALVAGVCALVAACGAGPESVPPLAGMRLLDPDLVLDDIQGRLHVRVFPKGALRCDAVAGHVRDAAGARVFQALPGGNVTPAVRCGPGYASDNVASPVDGCFDKGRPFTVDIPDEGTYLVLVHGQGEIRLPGGGTRPGILGAGCGEVTLRPGETRGVTIPLREQLPVGTCGDGTLDFDETCDDGPRNGTPGAACLATCQTAEQAVNSNPAGPQRRPAVAWAAGQRLMVVFDNDDEVFARFYTADGGPETTLGALLNEVVINPMRPSQQLGARIASHAGGFVAAWDTFQNLADFDVAAAAYGYDAPTATQAQLGTGTGDQKGAAVAIAGDRVLVAWQDDAARAVRAASMALASPLVPPTAPATVAMGDAASDVRAAALPDGFVVAWSAGGDVFARRLARDGAPTGVAARVNANAMGVQDQPAVAALPDGRAVVAWRDASQEPGDTDGTAIRWRLLDAAGAPAGDAHVAPTTTAGDQASPALAVAPGATPTVLFVWEDAPSRQIQGRLRTPDDREVRSRIGGSGGDFAVSVGAAGQGTRQRPAAAYGGPGRFVVVWEGEDADRAGIRLRVFPP